MSLRLAVVFLEWPEGNITNPDSNFLPSLKVILIDVGIPYGYLSSYVFPP